MQISMSATEAYDTRCHLNRTAIIPAEGKTGDINLTQNDKFPVIYF